MMRSRLLAGLCLIALALVSPAASVAHEIKPFTSGSYEKITSARRGTPFIIGFWSLYCGFCMTELDMFRKLAAKHPRLDLVLISTDTLDEQDYVVDTLAKYSLGNAEAWVFADSYAERLRFEVDKKWQGELPRTYFFGAKGDVKGVSGKVEEKEVERWIKEQYSSR